MFSSSLASLPKTLQGLLPEKVRFCLAVGRFLEKELEITLAGARILIGFSGGPDSAALLLALYYLAPGKGFSLAAAHLDHALRPSSAAEAEQCRVLCKHLGLECVAVRRDITQMRRAAKTGIEETGRAARYALYAETAARLECDWIALGHNANDLAEDLLMRLLRGTGWPALGGMDAIDRQRRLLRPLLLTPRNEIEEFLHGLDAPLVHDASNTDPAYLRNRIRSRLLPLFMEENPAFLKNAVRLWRLSRIDDDWLNTLLPSFASATPAHSSAPGTGNPKPDTPPSPEHLPSVFLPREQLETLPKALRLRLYKKALASLGPGQALVDGIFALDASWLAKGEQTSHRFPGRKTAQASHKGILFTLSQDA